MSIQNKVRCMFSPPRKQKPPLCPQHEQYHKPQDTKRATPQLNLKRSIDNRSQSKHHNPWMKGIENMQEKEMQSIYKSVIDRACKIHITMPTKLIDCIVP